MVNRILIVGFGSSGRRHLKLARAFFPESEIKVLTRNSSKEFVDFSDGWLNTEAQAIEFRPDIGVIANPSPFHIAISLALAKIGTHLLIEKPISSSTEGVKELIELMRDKGSTLLVGYNLRFSPSLVQFRKHLLEGIIGELYSFRSEVGQYLPDWRPNVDYRKSVSANQLLGGGVLLELSHELDYIRWIFGEIAWVRSTLTKLSTLEVDVEDSAFLTLQGLPTASSPSLTGTVSLDFIRRDTTRTCTVIGENGSLRWDGMAENISLYKAGAVNWQTIDSFAHSPDLTYGAEWENFVNSINGVESPRVTGEDGLRTLEIIEAARASSVSGQQFSLKRDETNSKAKG